MHNSDKVIVGSAQIHSGFAGQHYLPYSIGILQAHVLHNSKKKERYDFRSIIYKRELLNVCVKKLKDCQIILFSTYVWNEKISLAIAKETKKMTQINLLFLEVRPYQTILIIRQKSF